MLRVGLYYKNTVQAFDVASTIVKEVSRNGAKIFVEKNLDRLDGVDGVFSFDSPDIDVLIVVGGDGTLLRALHYLGENDIPVMTVRMGRRGFLLDVSPLEVRQRVRDLLLGRYRVEEYLRLEASIGGKTLSPALNEIAIISMFYGRTKVIRLNIYKDDQNLFSLDGDGVIIATPIGSTAYNLSAGGPILDPRSNAYVITPLAPVQLWLRPIVVPPDSQITVRVREDSQEAYVSIDGQEIEKVDPGRRVHIRRYRKPARIIRFTEGWFYERLFIR
jgi:NAD+ kinase